MKITVDIDGKLLAMLGVVQHSFTTTPKPARTKEYEAVSEEDAVEQGWKPTPLTIEQALVASCRVGAHALVHNATVGVLGEQSFRRFPLGRALGSHAKEVDVISLPGDADDACVRQVGVIDEALVSLAEEPAGR